MKEEKRTYNTKGKANTQIQVDRSDLFVLKAIAAINGQSKDEAIEQAIRLYNDKHREVLS